MHFIASYSIQHSPTAWKDFQDAIKTPKQLSLDRACRTAQVDP